MSAFRTLFKEFPKTTIYIGGTVLARGYDTSKNMYKHCSRKDTPKEFAEKITYFVSIAAATGH